VSLPDIGWIRYMGGEKLNAMDGFADLKQKDYYIKQLSHELEQKSSDLAEEQNSSKLLADKYEKVKRQTDRPCRQVGLAFKY
jgi:hypothetical protein